MDTWQNDQLKRMQVRFPFTLPHRHTSFSQLGGNAPFKDFIRSYPPEHSGYTDGIHPHALYHSWAATQYREKVGRSSYIPALYSPGTSWIMPWRESPGSYPTPLLVTPQLAAFRHDHHLPRVSASPVLPRAVRQPTMPQRAAHFTLLLSLPSLLTSTKSPSMMLILPLSVRRMRLAPPTYHLLRVAVTKDLGIHPLLHHRYSTLLLISPPPLPHR